MGKHVVRVRRSAGRIPRSRFKIAGAAAFLAVSATMGSLALGHADAATSAGTGAAADVDTTRTYGCPGREVAVSRMSDFTVRVACRYGVKAVGRTQTYLGRNSAIASTRLPARTVAGTLLVA